MSMEKEKTEQRGYQPFNNIGKFGVLPHLLVFGRF